MKDKIFMTFLCATLCVATNAMGAGVNWDEVIENIQDGCTVQKKSLKGDYKTFPADSYVGGGVTPLYMLEGSDDWLFVGKDSALMCDTHQMGKFYECGGNIVVTNGNYFFECKTGWREDKWEKHDPKTCPQSKVPDEVENSKIVKVEAYYVKEDKGYAIATSDLCVMRDCKDGYQYGEGKCVMKAAESNAVAGGTGSQNAGISGISANGSGNGSGASNGDSANGGGSGSGASNGNSANGGGNGSAASNGNSANGGGSGSGASNGNSANGGGNVSAASTVNNNDITMLGEFLDAETEKFERSKWRDAEGKFNTARLASDSIAAVVLGTAGGLVSSKVIKKKQVENGFEDIKCTIGSQEVADWGDEFQVGIQ